METEKLEVNLINCKRAFFLYFLLLFTSSHKSVKIWLILPEKDFTSVDPLLWIWNCHKQGQRERDYHCLHGVG
jgi:hypothetical protein